MNACDAMPGNGRITVTSATVTIDAAYRTTQGGAGLGLSTALGALRAHRGWMDVETLQDRGTTFRMLLPAAEPAAGVPGEAAREAALG